MSDIIKIENVVKQYRLGLINGGTLKADMQSWWARIRGKEDPNSKIGANTTKGLFRALDGVTFNVEEGERLGIIGQNGAGKSTLLKILSRVTAPTEGKIVLGGRVASMLEVGTGFHPELTGRENVYLNGAILGMSKSEVAAKFDEIVDFSEIGKFIDTPVKRYSSGMFVKLAFSVAAHLDAEIMVMDEVLAVGDMRFQQKCLAKMNQVSREEGRTILYVSHNMNTIKQLCSRCVVLNKGKVRYDGNVEKAVAIYMNQDDSSAKPYYDLRETPRPSINHGVRLRVESFEFLDSSDCVFDCDKPVRVRIRYTAYEDLDNIRIRFEFHASDCSPSAMAESDVIGDVKKGKTYSTELMLNISCVAEGSYYFRVDVYNIDSCGVHVSYDHPEQDIYITVDNYRPDKIVWQARYWGYTRLENMKPVVTEEL